MSMSIFRSSRSVESQWSPWLSINIREFVHTHEMTHASASPYEIPDAVRAKYDHREDMYSVEFRYIDGAEPTVLHRVFDGFWLRIGRHSNRLLRFDVKREFLDSIVQKCADAIAAPCLNDTPLGVANQPYAAAAFQQRRRELLAVSM